MMKTIITGDFHIGQISDSFIEENGLERSVNETMKQLYAILDYARKNEIKHIIVAGDIFENNNPASKYYELFFDWLTKCDYYNIEIDLIAGNHDANNSSVSSLAPIKESFSKLTSRILVIDDNIYHGIINDINYIYIPHLTKSQLGIKDVADYEEKAKEIIKVGIRKNINEKTLNIIIGHLHAIGAVVGSEQRKLKGGINFFPDVDMSEISKIFLGHIHKHQILKMKKVDTFYCGSIVRNDFSEAKEDKGFLIFNDENMEVSFIKLDTIEYKEININMIDKDYPDLDGERIKKVASNKVVKLIINISEDNRKRLNINEIEEAFNKYCFVAKVDINIERKDKKDNKMKSFNPLEIAEEYINKNIKDEEQRKFILQESLDILKDVL